MNENINTPPIPEGYRLLRPGSKIVKGDKYYCDYDWHNVTVYVGNKYDFNEWHTVLITNRPKRIRQKNQSNSAPILFKKGDFVKFHPVEGRDYSKSFVVCVTEQQQNEDSFSGIVLTNGGVWNIGHSNNKWVASCFSRIPDKEVVKTLRECFTRK